jgi:DNA-binding PadR family transcriptional regulator
VSSSSGSRRPTPSPEYPLLGFLKQNATHGYDLHQQLTMHLGQVWHISLSQTYNILNRLESQDFITGSTQEQSKLPDRRRFRLTPAGRRRFDEWFSDVSGCSVHSIRIEFTTRLFFAQSEGPAVVRNVIEAQIAKTEHCLRRLQELQAELPADQPFNRLGTDLRLDLLSSTLEWMRDCGTALGIQVETNNSHN